MERFTVTKEQLLNSFREAHNSTNEDIRLRLTKQDIKDFVINGDKYSWYELLPEFLPEKPKRYVVTAEQFQAILYAEQDKLGKLF